MGNKLNGSSLAIPEIPDSVDNAVKNLTDKPTLSIGQTISDLWQLALGGRIGFAAEKQKLKYAAELEEYRKELENKVYAIPLEKQIEPPLQIAAQALQDSQYCVESSDLRNMFSSLIANSMNSDYSSIIHPSFSKIIQQMSPLDAQMLKIMAEWQKRGGIAVISYTKKASTDGYVPLLEHVPAQLPEDCSSTHAARSMVSLQRLGLIDIQKDVFFRSDARYEVFEKTPLFEALNRQASIKGYKVEMRKECATLTALGEDFVSLCID